MFPAWLKAQIDNAYVAEAGCHDSDSVLFEHLTVFFRSEADPHLKVVAHIPCRYTNAVSKQMLSISISTLTFGV